MAKRRKALQLDATARFYERDTQRARLRSPGIERFLPRRRSPAAWVAAVILAAALLLALLVWLALP